MRRTLLFAALLLLAEAARADRSSTWWADSSTASLSDSHTRTGAGQPGRVAPNQRAAQDGLEPLQQAGGDAL